MKEKNFISAVVYVNNCEKNIENFLNHLIKILEQKFLKFEIICVNDASTDNSVNIIKKMANKINGNITVINMSYYQGRELSMNAGVDLSIGDFVYEFDSTTIDYDLKTIFKIYEDSLEGYDIVNAAPEKSKYKFANNQYDINTETFRILSRRAINRINSINKSIPYRKAIYANCGLKVKTIYYKTNIKDKESMSKNQKKDREKTATNALLLFTDIGFRISIFLSFLMMAITLIVGIYTIIVFIGSNPIAGWTTTMLFLSFGFFGIFGLFAFILKYLSLIINIIFKNKKYLIESIDKIN